jgi:hypothetical protein
VNGVYRRIKRPKDFMLIALAHATPIRDEAGNSLRR